MLKRSSDLSLGDSLPPGSGLWHTNKHLWRAETGSPEQSLCKRRRWRCFIRVQPLFVSKLPAETARLTSCWLPGGVTYVKPKERRISSRRAAVRWLQIAPGPCVRAACDSVCTWSAAAALLCFIRVALTAHARATYPTLVVRSGNNVQGKAMRKQRPRVRAVIDSNREYSDKTAGGLFSGTVTTKQDAIISSSLNYYDLSREEQHVQPFYAHDTHSIYQRMRESTKHQTWDHLLVFSARAPTRTVI